MLQNKFTVSNKELIQVLEQATSNSINELYWPFDFDRKLEDSPNYLEQDQYQYAFCYVLEFINNTLHLIFLASLYDLDFDGGGFERFELEYDIDDALSIRSDIVFYQSGDFRIFKMLVITTDSF